MTEPNDNQQQLIDAVDGTYLVDAGPGTGKTFAITRRYASLLEEPGVDPEDILLVTFSRNAAAEMRDRIVQHTDYDMRRLQDAPISTFHAYCYRLLRRYGHTTPRRLGIDDLVPRSLDLLEDEVREDTLFRAFFSQFEDDHPEHEDVFALVSDPTPLRSLVAELAAKGAIPTADGWYRGSGSLLEGDRAGFLKGFAAANEPVQGANGLNQSDALTRIKRSLDSDMTPYPESAPDFEYFVGGVQANPDAVERAFDEDREHLRAFVHDLYHEYLAFALSRNYLTHGLMLTLAFVLLCEDHGVRERVRHDYVMIDEFQDTNEIQFKIAVLLAAEPNICVVGDWKQSIYGFQYTTVENILQFDSRLERYIDELNRDVQRVPFEDVTTEELTLEENYRSTASLIDLAVQSLTIPATNSEDLDAAAIRAQITELEHTNYVDNSQIGAYTHEEELDVVLDRIQHIVGNPDYAIEEHDDPQPDDDATEAEQRAAEEARLAPPTYDDIAVFTRTRSFARELLDRAGPDGVPIAYEGGVELFDTDQAKLLLAWLRICESDARRGWAVVLEEAGFTLGQTGEVLETASYPPAMAAFRDELRETETLGSLTQRVFERYGFHDAYADALLAELTSLYEGTINTRAEAIEFMQSKLEAGATPEIDASPGEDAVTLQTMHSAKGLEYPIVILANLNQRQFPHHGVPSRSPIRYDDTVGLRQTKVAVETDTGRHLFDNWCADVVRGALPSKYDEERRLFYVAMTRAKRHLLFTAGEDPSNFFTELSVEATELEPEVSAVEVERAESEELDVTIPPATGPIRAGVHDIMDDSVFEAVTEGRGTEFGAELHDFAEAYARGESVSVPDEEHAAIGRFIDSLAGDLLPEQPVLCPLDGDPRIVLTGLVDLLHVDSDRVDIVDYKTDLGRVGLEEYRTQLSVYWHVLAAEYPEREIRAVVYYTADDERVPIEPRSMAELRAIAEASLLDGV